MSHVTAYHRKTHHITANQSGTSQLVTRSTRHTVKSFDELTVVSDGTCDELTVLPDLAFVAFKSFAVIGDFDIAHIKPK